MEILTSLLIFSLGIVILIQSLSNVIRSSQDIRDNYKAMLLIENILNRMISDEELALTGQQIIQEKVFNWQIESASSAEGLKTITVTINWKSGSRSKQTVFEQKIIAFNQ